MKTSLYVISDLHLGGAPAGNGARGFQICPPATQNVLAGFIRRLPRPTQDWDRRLVIAGDIVDFLAEEPFEAFTADPSAAQAKLESIVKNTAPVWSALQEFVRDRHGALTLMLGNHDVELSLPGPRQWLLEQIGPGRVDFLCDNQAFTLGRVLIEHGNRFDAWNAVPHDSLRRVRSQVSRRLPIQPPFPALPGSRLVVDVMNGLKKDYPFIDLLKPEDACALPIAAALGAGSGRDAWNFFQRFRQQRQADYDEEGEPLDPENISAADDEEAALFQLAQDIAAGGDAEAIGAGGDLLRGIAGAVTEQVRALRREALYRAFRGALRRLHRTTFAVEEETDDYCLPARRAADAGFEVVVYGHTHLAKRVPLMDDQAFPMYLNTGTWADLMRLPNTVWAPQDGVARAALREFVDDLEHNRLERWRRSVPTYARIDVDDDVVTSADLYFGDDDERVTTEALKRRLASGDADA
jgi:UDP-2,3-diacylglucosamine pyrophosphatase LpxH